LHLGPVAPVHDGRRRARGLGPRRRAAGPRARLPPAAGGPQALRVEEREVAARPRVHGPERTRLLGGSWLPHPRGPLARGALLVRGEPGLRDPAVAGAAAFTRRGPGASRCSGRGPPGVPASRTPRRTGERP